MHLDGKTTTFIDIINMDLKYKGNLLLNEHF